MRGTLRILGSFIVLAAIALPAITPAAADVSDEDIARARAQLDAAREEADDITARISDALELQAHLDSELGDLARSIEQSHIDVQVSRGQLQDTAIRLYMEATSGQLVGLLQAGDAGDLQAALQYLQQLGGDHEQLLDRLRTSRAELDRALVRLSEAQGEQAELTSDLQVLGEELQAKLASSQTNYETLVERQRQEEEERRRRAEEERLRRAEEERRRQEEARNATSTTGEGETSSTTTPGSTTTTLPPPPPTGPEGWVCPVNGPVSFKDTWGAARSGGRGHKGVDMMSARGTPIVAVGDGHISKMSVSYLGGITLWVRTINGDTFYYAHMDSYAPGIQVGMEVRAGDLVGTNGSTGNAPSWLPHLHWEWHPGGGSAVNPTPLATQLCG